jgi:hypothetical protein
VNRHLAATVAGYAFVLMVWSGWRAVVSRRGPDVPQLAAAAFLELALVVQALIEGVRLLRGGRAAEPATHFGYLVASVVVLPLALQATSPDRTRWDGAVLAVGALAAAVVAIRLRVTA